MKELINFIKEKQKEYNQDSSAYKVLRELEVIIPSMFKDNCQSQKAQVWEEGFRQGRKWEPFKGTVNPYLIETKK